LTTNSGELQGGASRVRPLRVAMVGNASTIHSIVRGGAIAAMGHHVRLVTLGPPLATTDFEVRTRPIPRSVLAGLLAFRSFQRDLREFHPDILHVHYAGGRLGSLALASGIKPLVVTVMGGDVQPEQHMGQLGLLDRRATRRLLGESALILAKSQLLADKVALLGDYAGKTEVVRWGIDLERFRHDEARGQALRERLKLGPGPVLLSPRVLRPLYNIQLIVDAMPAILQTCSGAQLLISRLREDPKYTERVRNRVLELGLSGQVHFIEAFDYESMPALLSLTDVVISVPFSDGLPQTLFESLASETPIVQRRCPAFSRTTDWPGACARPACSV